jgi:hypothetical protein
MKKPRISSGAGYSAGLHGKEVQQAPLIPPKDIRQLEYKAFKSIAKLTSPKVMESCNGARRWMNLAAMGACAILHCSLAPLAIAEEVMDPGPVPIPKLKPSGGLRVQSQGAGTANTVSGYLFAPFGQKQNGSLAFLDFSANLNIEAEVPQTNTVNAGLSTRLGYRWLDSRQSWIYGVNAGIDTRPAYSQYAVQAGVGAEALGRSLELRLNGYIPFANTSELYAKGWTNASLANNQLLLDGLKRYVVAVGGVDLEAGIPLSTWSNGSLWAYASYYYLSGDDVSGTSGVRGRAEVRVGSQLTIGATLSYDNLFFTQATGFIRYGSKPLAESTRDAAAQAERNFLALRGLPVVREGDVRLVATKVTLPNTVAINPRTGQPWVVRCTGNTRSKFSIGCDNTSMDALLAAARPGDLLLAGGSASSDLSSRGLRNGRPTLRLPPGTQLRASGNAPWLDTQFGAANLNQIFGSTVGPQATLSNGVIRIGNNTSIKGFNFTNTSITNYGNRNIALANNTFTGSYSSNPTQLATAKSFGAINISADALPAIQLRNIENLAISANTFIYPQVQSYRSQVGTNGNQPPTPVCNQNDFNQSGLCLAGNAIRLTNTSNTSIQGNTVIGALDEAFRINNPSGSLTIDSNTISQMRMGPDSNIGTAIIIGQNKGSSTVTIANNTFSNNSPGVYPRVTGANQTGVATAIASDPDDVRINNIDPIEVGLCRGSENYPRFQDLYADASFSGNCASPTRMTIRVYNNTIRLPRILGRIIKQDGDGIDFNLGSNSILNATLYSNKIVTLGAKEGGDNGITFDARGNTKAHISITDNTIFNTGGEAIDFTLTNTSKTNQTGRAEIFISGNTFGGSTETLLQTTLINNPGLPVSVFRINGGSNNGKQIAETIPRFSDFNSGPFPNLYLNGTLYQEKTVSP